MKYILVDTLNMFFRAKHVTARTTDIDMKVGMAMHIMFNSVKKVWREFDGDHVIFCLLQPSPQDCLSLTLQTPTP